MSITPDANGGDTDRPSNVLLLAPSIGADEDAVCEELLHSTGTHATHALVVTYLDSPTERLGAWTDRGGDPERTTVVDVDTQARSTAVDATGDAGPTPGGPESRLADATVDHVADPDALVTLGEVLDRHLSGREGETTSLCFHSLTDVLGVVDREQAFKFLEVLTRSVEHAGAIGHYHLDPDVHDPETVATLEVLFDVVVDLRGGSRR